MVQDEGQIEAQNARAQRSAVMMLASISIDGGPFHTVRVRNLSSTGLGGRSDQPLREGGNVEIRLGGAMLVKGKIVRTNGREFGIAFAAPCDFSSLKRGPPQGSAFEVSPLHQVSGFAKRPKLRS
jgi:hypothetical protein